MIDWCFARILIDERVGWAVDDLLGSNADSASEPLCQTGLARAEIADECDYIAGFQGFPNLLTNRLCFLSGLCVWKVSFITFTSLIQRNRILRTGNHQTLIVLAEKKSL